MKLRVERNKSASLLGIDVGTKFTGFAITKDLHRAQVLGVHISNNSIQDKCLYEKILKYLRKEQVQGIIIGQPQTRNQFIVEFQHQLIECLRSNKIDCPITGVPEHLTTVKAQQIQYKMTKTQDKLMTDGIAAVLILETFLKQLSIN